MFSAFLAKSSCQSVTSHCKNTEVGRLSIFIDILLDSTLLVIDIHQNMPISFIFTPFDYFQINLSFAVTPNLILEPCLMRLGMNMQCRGVEPQITLISNYFSIQLQSLSDDISASRSPSEGFKKSIFIRIWRWRWWDN